MFKVKKRAEISEREINFVLDELRKDIEKYDLKNSPQNPMSIFIKMHFPSAWKIDKD